MTDSGLASRLAAHGDALLLLPQVDVPVSVLDAGPDMLQILSPLRLRVTGVVNLGFRFVRGKDPARVVVTAQVVSSETSKGQTGLTLKVSKVFSRSDPELLAAFLQRHLSHPNATASLFQPENKGHSYYPATGSQSVRALKENTIEVVGPDVPRHQPVAVRVPVQFEVAGSGQNHGGVAYNVSPLAVSVLSDSCVPHVDDEASVIFPFKKGDTTVSIVLRGRVSWVIPRTPQHATGFGIQLGKLAKPDAKNWVAFITAAA